MATTKKKRRHSFSARLKTFLETEHPRGPAGRFRTKGGPKRPDTSGRRPVGARKATEAGLMHRKLAAAADAAEREHRTLKARGVKGKAYTDALDRSIRLKRATHAARQARAKELVTLRTKQAARTSGGPIAAKLKAYREGDRLAAKVAGIKGADLDAIHEELAGHRDTAAVLVSAIVKAKPGSEGYRKLLEQHAAAVESTRHAEVRLRNAGTVQREAALKAIGVKSAHKWQDEKGKPAGKLPEAVRSQHAEAAEFIGKVVGDRGKTGTIGWTAGAYGTRSDYQNRGPDTGRIKISGDADTATVVHEWGHAIEHQVPGVRQAARDFLDHRVGSEKGVPLSESIGEGNYRKGEVGRSDKFAAAFGDAAPYVGKEYGFGATEIVSMGVEKLYRDPVGFARKDPEYFKFIVGTLHGTLK